MVTFCYELFHIFNICTKYLFLERKTFLIVYYNPVQWNCGLCETVSRLNVLQFVHEAQILGDNLKASKSCLYCFFFLWYKSLRAVLSPYQIYLLKVNNKSVALMPLLLNLNKLHNFFSVSIVNFEREFVCWERTYTLQNFTLRTGISLIDASVNEIKSADISGFVQFNKKMDS